MGRRVSGNAGTGGSSPRAIVRATSVPLTAGVLDTIPNPGLLTPVVWTKGGGDPNLTVNPSSGAISAATALSAGVTQDVTGSVTGADGCLIPFSVNLTGVGAVELVALSGSFTLAEDAALNAVAGPLSGKTAGSTLSLPDDAGGRVALSGSNVVRGATALDYETGTSHSFTIRETLAGATNSPRDTVLTFAVSNIFEQPDLVDLSVSPTSFAANAAAGTVLAAISGQTSGSTLSLIDDQGGMFALSGTDLLAGLVPAPEGAYAPVIRETLADSSNSPHDTVLSLTATAAGFVLPALTTAKMDGDSRTDNQGSRVVSSGSLVLGAGTGPSSSSGFIQPLIGNKWLLLEGYQHAIGASTTEAMMYRAQSTSIATSGNTGRPAWNGRADSYTVSVPANVPFAGKFSLGQVQARSRNDV